MNACITATSSTPRVTGSGWVRWAALGIMFLLVASAPAADGGAPGSPPSLPSSPEPIPVIPAPIPLAARGFLSMTIPDGARVRNHWASSVLNRVVTAGMSAPDVSRGWDAAIRSIPTLTHGAITADLLCAALVSCQVVIPGFISDDIIGSHPCVSAVADFGDHAATIYTQGLLAAIDHPEAITVPGADAAGHERDQKEQAYALFHHQIVIMDGSSLPLAPWRIPASDADILIHFDLPDFVRSASSLSGTLPPHALADLGAWTYQGTITTHGIDSVLAGSCRAPWLAPVDLHDLDWVPANALAVLTMGLDGRQGSAFFQKLLALVSDDGAGGTGLEESINMKLTEFNVTATIGTLLASLKGGVTIVIAPGVPFPSVTIVGPGSASLDQCFTQLLNQAGVSPPAPKGIAMFAIPGLPLMMGVAHDHGQWLISSDVMTATTWAAGAHGGWTGSPLGRQVLLDGQAGSAVLGGADTPGLFRMVLALTALDGSASRADGNAVRGLLTACATGSGPSTLAIKASQHGISIVDHGFVGLGSMLTCAAVGLGSTWCEARIQQVDRLAAIAALKQIAHGEAVIQARDDHHYAFLRELAASRTADAGGSGVPLISPAIARDRFFGYRIRMYLPNGDADALAEPPPGDALPHPSPGSPRDFAAYAWLPGNSSLSADGGEILAVTSDGIIRSGPWLGMEPMWNAVFSPPQRWGSRAGWPAAVENAP